MILPCCNKIVKLPRIVNSEVSYVDNTSVIVVFEIDGENNHGINPKVEYCIDGFGSSGVANIVEATMVDGKYEAQLMDLEINTTYYYRYYLPNNAGGYIMVNGGASFFTPSILPMVSTTGIKYVHQVGTSFSAMVSAEVIHDGGNPVTERGICWSLTPEPSIEGDHISNGAGIGYYDVTITDLSPSSLFYVRAYAKNGNGIAYGDELSFTTGFIWQDGVLPGLFSVSENQQVRFSQGNLQYRAAIDIWRFAEKQYEVVGDGNINISPTYSEWIDLFCWGTSGYNHGAVCYQPWSTSKDYSDYFAYGQGQLSLSDETGQADWGYNAVMNGGCVENHWRTLTSSEWRYVFNTRSTSSGIRFAKAVVENANGIILLPDTWNATLYSFNNTNMIEVNYNSNIITALDWLTLEENGAVFLPEAGIREGTSYRVDKWAYWSTTPHYNTYAYGMYSTGYTSNFSRGNGLSVRLVRND